MSSGKSTMSSTCTPVISAPSGVRRRTVLPVTCRMVQGPTSGFFQGVRPPAARPRGSRKATKSPFVQLTATPKAIGAQG